MKKNQEEKIVSSSAFFENKECEYYPCHQGLEEINCLFCFCPLFWDCPFPEGGNKSKGMNCPDCIYPHKRGNYGALMNSLHQMYDRQHKNDPDYVDGSV